MSDPLSILRAQVEAASQGDIWFDRASYIRAPRAEPVHDTTYVTIAECMNMSLGDVLPDKANAELLVAGWNLLRRMVSDEGIEQAAAAYENALYGGVIWPAESDFQRQAYIDAMRVALSSLLTGGV